MRTFQYLTQTRGVILGLGVLQCVLMGCGFENAPNRSFVNPEPPIEGLRGQEWVPETVPPLKVGGGAPVNGFDFEIQTRGAQRVVRGNNLIFWIQIVPKLGPLSGRAVTYSTTGLPLEMNARYPLLQGNSQAEASDHF
ncbi:MAG: hypothetical protein K2X47_10600, partial [Bdellovibrionales bacterium]|nr:hypothetical protein [Bdellovibrionales bacterium]